LTNIKIPNFSFDPAFDPSANEYDGYNSIFNAVLQLEQAQRDYINNYTSTYNSNHPDCQAGSQAADLYLQAVLDTAFADASGTNQENSPINGGRLEFPIVDTEATILVTPGESEAEVYIEGFPAGIDITVRPGENGGYIFVPADDDAAALLHGIPGFPVTDQTEINIGLVYNVEPTRRAQTGADTTCLTETAARREAIRRWGGQVSEPNNFTRVVNWDRNPNVRGPNGEPTEWVDIIDLDGNPVRITHHSWGHVYNDNNTFEYPHFEGPNGEHISYIPQANDDLDTTGFDC